MHIRLSVFLVVLGLFVGACHDTATPVDPLPYAYVYEQVFLNEARAIPLTVQDGSFIYISGGLKGIILYRKAPGQFTALERQSPGKGSCRVRVDVTRQYVVDTCTSSQFNFDGYLLTGSASANLRPYAVAFDGTKITITN